MISAVQVPQRPIRKALVCVFAVPVTVFRPAILFAASHDDLIASLPQRLGDSKDSGGARVTLGKAERTRVNDPARDAFHDLKITAIHTSGVPAYARPPPGSIPSEISRGPPRRRGT